MNWNDVGTNLIAALILLSLLSIAILLLWAGIKTFSVPIQPLLPQDELYYMNEELWDDGPGDSG